MESGLTFDVLKGGLLLAGIALAAMGLVSVALSFIVALRQPPARRAGWTAGAAYALVAFGGTFLHLFGAGKWTPLIAAPGALAVFYYWWLSLRYGWTADVVQTPEGPVRQKDDWREGLFCLALAMAAGAAVALLHVLIRSL